MRILHISTRLILGGSQENTVLSCEGQARLGHEVHLAFGPIYGPEGSLLERVRAFNARCDAGEEKMRSGDSCTPIGLHEVPDLCREIKPLRDRRCVAQLKRLIRELKPDVVHTHSSKAGILGRIAAWSVCNERFPSASAGLLETGDRAPAEEKPIAHPQGFSPLPIAHCPLRSVIHTIHGPPFMPIEGGAVARTKTRFKNYLYTLAERHAAKRCHTIVSVADAMTQQYLARKIGRPEQYVTVRSGMEITPFLEPAPGEDRESVRDSLGFVATDYVIGTVARLAEHKGHDDLLDALGDELRTRDNWRLLWVGDGWWRERLMRRVESMGLGGKVVTTGLVPPERVPGLVRAMDVLAHPSYREGLPRTVPQALLAGVTPIAYDVDGTREACIDGETGVLAPPGDHDALHAGVLKFYDDPELRARLAAHGREMCRDLFSAERMVDELEKVYGRALER